MKRELTCIACPLGCVITVALEGKTVVSVTGNTCARGREYAINDFASKRCAYRQA